MSTDHILPTNIVDGTDEIIRDAINSLTGGHEWYRTKTTMNELSSISPREANFTELIGKLWETIETNWRRAGARAGGKANWRWEPQLHLDHDENESAETKLEKGLATILPKALWTNQVPTASGLISPSSDRKRNIDLAYWDGSSTVTLIELKVASDTPVYAAFEIVRNGLLLCLARVHHDVITITDVRWRKASHLQLRVVAPADFYFESGKPRALGWFEDALDQAVVNFAKTLPGHVKLTMNFGFRIFDLPSALLNAVVNARPFLP